MTDVRQPLLACALLLLCAAGPVAAADDAGGGAGGAMPLRLAAASGLSLASTTVTADDWVRDDWDWVDEAPYEPGDPSGEKSVFRAVAASFLLPGLGERYVGRTGRAKVFHLVESAIWTTFAVYRIQGEHRKDRAVEFAQRYAGANPDGDDDYLEHIGYWISLDEWHEIVRRDARLAYPDDPVAQAEHFERNKRYDEADRWLWPDDDVRLRFRVLRSRSERAYRNARLAVGAAFLNRLASMIDALAVTRKHNRQLREEGQARLALRVGPQNTVDGLVVGPIFSATF
jgi:hypothetical protein